jgi:DNA-binding transcriptional ArsR family regulator
VVHYGDIDRGFAAIADPTRRAVLERLGRGEATVSELAAPFDITLTGMKKHVQVLEAAKLVTTEKVGRARVCRLGPQRLDGALEWLERYRALMADRFDRFDALLERERGRPE